MNDNGDAIGRFELAISYLEGTDASNVNAIKWLKKAFDLNMKKEVCEAIHKRFSEIAGRSAEFDSAYETTKGRWDVIEEANALRGADKAAAFKLYLKASEMGSAQAQNWIGRYYYCGWGDCEKDEAKAVEWYRRAAEQGYATAQDNLGQCYECGTGVDKDYDKALLWYRKAVE